MTDGWDTGQRTFDILKSDSSPLFVGCLVTLNEFKSLRKVFNSEEHRRSSWLILSNPKMSSTLNDLHLPLDHKSYPYVMYDRVNKDGTVSFDGMRGIKGELFNILKQTMNFTPHCFENVDLSWGNICDGKWTGLVGDLVEDRADIAVADLDWNYLRSQAVDYPYGWQNGEYHLLMRHVPALENVGNSYTKEFTWPVWLLVMLFGLILCLSLLFGLRQSPYHEEKHLSEIIWLTVAAFCNTGVAVSTVSVSSRMLLLVLYMTVMMLHAYYNSFLISSLTVETDSLPFTTMEGMYKAGTHSFGIFRGTSIEDIFKFSPIPLHKHIWNEMVMANPENLIPSLKPAKTRLCTKNHVILVSDNILWTEDWPCKVRSLPGTYFSTQKSLPLQKNSPLLPAFRFQMKKLVETGIVNRLRRKWKRSLYNPETKISPISLLQASTAFLLLLLGISFALMFLIIEIILAKLQKRHTSTRY
ncbi:probable glutamate receptor isoform X2 [Palaemon carinicauda]|uniref:probable glutamate receptor isoform X2 n=1 Tax=Palaemon carinicauda TaxID=392227 RepID=UPI0035B5CAB9